MAFNTTTDTTDIIQYQQLESHLMIILQTNAGLTDPSLGLTAGNITEINDTIGLIQANLQAIVAAAALTP